MADKKTIAGKIGKVLVDASKSRARKYKTKRDPKLVVANVDKKQAIGTPDFERSENVVKKYGRAKKATGVAIGVGATLAAPKVYEAGKYLYSNYEIKKKDAPGAAAKPATASSAKANASKVTQARKEQVAANTQKTKANAQMTKATTNKEKVAANKTKVAANARMVAANKKKVAANTARYKK
jgi:hypothetical protein